MPNLEAMSDDALRRACEPSRLEQWLDRSGCAVAIVVTAAVLGALAWLALAALRLSIPAPGLLCAVLFPPLCLACFVVITHLAGRRRMPYREELAYRYGAAHIRAYFEETRSLLEQADAPDWALLVSAASLPYGGHRWLRALVWTSPAPHSRVEVRETSFGSGGIASAVVRRDEREGGEQATTRLTTLLQSPGPGGLSNLTPRVKDGLSCTVAIFAQGSAREHVGSCNLAGTRPADERHPSVMYARALLEQMDTGLAEVSQANTSIGK